MTRLNPSTDSSLFPSSIAISVITGRPKRSYQLVSQQGLKKFDALVAPFHLWFCHEFIKRLQVAGTKVSPQQRVVPTTTALISKRTNSDSQLYAANSL